MLKSIICEKIIETTLIFKSSLNSVVGADDAHNSIGKSSILMLIDFAFGGDDFPIKCDDVIKNIGDFDVGMVFEFDKTYSFVRNTSTSNDVYHIEEQSVLTIEDFRIFLQKKYNIDKNSLSFRECVSGFYRIYQRDNYNDKRPLDNSNKEGWLSIRKRILKLFNEYNTIEKLEQNKKTETERKNDIKGTFNTGAITKINKRTFKLNEDKILELRDLIASIKKALETNVTDIKSLISKENSELKRNKDSLIENINDINKEIQTIDEKLLEIVDSKEESVYMLEKLIELDRLEKRLTQQNNFWEKDEDVKEKIKSISSDIKYALVDSVEKIQTTINEELAKYIKRIYTENPISPKIHIFDNDYNFDRGDDRGTGKGFANMISLDLTFLEKTCLPNIIHDSLLFKNMDVTSIENLISTYSYFDKQIFISIDETSKYKINTQRIIKDSQFLKLDKDRVAFGVKWKNKTTP